jgi:hypothetical protein
LSVHQEDILSTKTTKSAGYVERLPQLFVTVVKKEKITLFIDIEEREVFVNDEGEVFDIDVIALLDRREVRKKMKPESRTYLEIDTLVSDSSDITDVINDLCDDLMKGFGLTKSKDELLTFVDLGSPVPLEFIKDRLKPSEPISEDLFKKLVNSNDRTILTELKKRGSILSTDLHEIPIGEVSGDRIKNTLDYLSGKEYRLVERKFAIVCEETKEIIFLLPSQDDIESVKALECPKCSKPIINEIVTPYYAVTDELKTLIDGNRWMPLLIHNSIVQAGVKKAWIFTEVKHGEDEIDVLTFYKNHVLVIEAKDRSVNLNDAYKLSAKTSRLETLLSRYYEEHRKGRIRASVRRYGYQYVSEKSPWIFDPIVISTKEIANDAKNLLLETRSNSKMLENSENRVDEFITDIINEINQELSTERFGKLTSTESYDSVSRLAGEMMSRAFTVLCKTIQ